MKANVMVGAALAVMLVLAALPQAWAVVEDPRDKILMEYGYNPDQHYETVDGAAEKAWKDLTSKSENELTKEEAVYLGEGFLYAKAGPPSSADQKMVDKAIYYFNLALQKDPDYAIAIWHLSNAYGMKKDYQKELYYLDKFIQLNPDGTVKDYGQSDAEALNHPIMGGVAWASIDGVLNDMEYAGYSIPQKIRGEFIGIQKGGWYKDFKTKEDLEKIGYFEIREKYLKPLWEKKPLSHRVADTLSSDPAVQRLIVSQFPFLAFLAAVVALVAVWGTIKLGRRATRH